MKNMAAATSLYQTTYTNFLNTLVIVQNGLDSLKSQWKNEFKPDPTNEVKWVSMLTDKYATLSEITHKNYNIDCTICTNESVLAAPFECEHTVCLACAVHHFLVESKHGQGSFSRCPICRKTYSMQSLEKSIENKIHKALGLCYESDSAEPKRVSGKRKKQPQESIDCSLVQKTN